MNKKLWTRPLATAPFLALVVLFSADPAHAVGGCLRDGDTDQVKIAPKASSFKEQARAVARQQDRNSWQDVVWRGTEKKCASNSPGNCNYSWAVNKTTNFGWAVGGQVSLGNASSPSKKWYNFVLSLIPSIQKSSTISTTETFEQPVPPGGFGQPWQVVQRRWKSGDYVGGWVNQNRACTFGLNQAGHVYTWDPNVRWGYWQANIREREYDGIAVNGKL